MSDFKKLFRKKETKAPSAEITQDDYRNIRVMRDDLEELSGKTHKANPVSDPNISAQAQVGNPFLENQSVTASVTQPTETAKSELVENIPVTVSDTSVKLDQKAEVPMPSSGGSSKDTLKWIIIGGASILVIGIGVFVFFFFFSNDGSKTASGVVDQPVTQPADTSAPTDNPTPFPVEPLQVFSSVNPNYLVIDTESVGQTKEGVMSVLDETAAKVGSMAQSAPIEFIVRDNNNNPIAFSRFAYLLGLKLPSEMLSSVNESFSIAFVSEGSTVRRVLTVNVKDSSLLPSSIQKNEPSLPSLFGSLLYGKDFVIPTAMTFNDGTFGALKTRYAIVDQTTDSSFDNIVLGNTWIIGTSKNSFRLVLGNLIQKQSQN